MAIRKGLRNLLRVLRYLDGLHESAYAKLRSGESDRFETSYANKTKIADDLNINYDTLNEFIQFLTHANLLDINPAPDGSLRIGLVQEWRDSFLRDAISSKEIREYYDLDADTKAEPQEHEYRQIIEAEDGFLIPISAEEALKAPFELIVKSKKGSFTLHVDSPDRS